MPGTPNTTNTPLSQATLFNKIGIGKYNMTVGITLANVTAAAQFHITPGHKGRITKVTYVTIIPAATAGRLATLTPSIGGVNVTGGALALNTVNCDTRDEEVPGTPITGNNSFTDSQTITFTGSAVTAFAEGTGMVIVELVNDDTNEVLAIANDGLRNP